MKTYECKINDESTLPFLRELNGLFGIWVRKLFVLLYANPVDDRNHLKRTFQKQMGVSSTHYNSIKNHVDGAYRSRRELGLLQYKDVQSRIKYTKATISRYEKALIKETESLARVRSYLKAKSLHRIDAKFKKPRKLSRKIDLINLSIPRYHRHLASGKIKFKIHHKKRRLAILESKAEKLEHQIKANRWSLCFGSKQLLRKQNYLQENAYKNHSHWKEDWTFSRSNQSYWLGDTKEKARNRNAKLSFEGSIARLRLTVPEALREKYGSFISVSNLVFDQRAEEQIKKSLEAETGKSPLSYRILERQKIVHDKQGNPHQVRQMYLQVSLEERYDSPSDSTKATGAIGVDLNCDHLAMGEIDRSGNPVHGFHLDYFKGSSLEGKSSDQITAMFGDHIRDIVAFAKLKHKPIAIEKLDFQRKKAGLRELHGPKMARLLSSFAYAKFASMMSSRCKQEGVELILVNPAFSSVLGTYNYFGLKHLYSSHQMAAFVLARRGMGFHDSLKCTYNERSHTALLRAVSIAPEKAPPTFAAWIKGGGKRHRWSLLRRYYQTYSQFVKQLRSKPPPSLGVLSPQVQRRIVPLSPQNLLVSSV